MVFCFFFSISERSKKAEVQGVTLHSVKREVIDYKIHSRKNYGNDSTSSSSKKLAYQIISIY